MIRPQSSSVRLRGATARNLLIALVGLARPSGIVIALLFLVSLAMVADAVDRTLKRLVNVVVDRNLALFWSDGPRLVVYDLALMAIVALAFLTLFWLARRVHRRMDLRAEASIAPRPAQVLLLLLSPGKSLEELANVADVDDPALFKHNWLMPAIAVRHHRDALRRVVLFASEKTGIENSEWRDQVAAFAALARRVANNPDLKVETPADHVTDDHLQHAIRNGVNMENMEQLVRAIDETFRALTDDRSPDAVTEREIMFDVTGGTRIGTSAMTAVALAYDAHWQYCQSGESGKRVISYRTQFVAAEK